MVHIKQVRAANLALKTKPTTESLTAVFTGATNGIGKATLEAFTKHIPNPTAVIVGRSKEVFSPTLENLKSLNPRGDFVFLEADISLTRNIDAVSKRIIEALHGRPIDLLSMSQGYLPFNGRETNADGFDNSIGLRYYGRVRFTENLLPYLSPNACVLSILAGGKEGKLFEDDLDLEKNFSLSNGNAHFCTTMTLSFDYLAKQNPEKSFLHIFPGLVSTGLLGRSAQSFPLGPIMRWIVDPLISLFATTPEESGERMLHYVTGGEFPTGSWALDWDGTSKENNLLKEYRGRNMAETIHRHNVAMFERALKG